MLTVSLNTIIEPPEYVNRQTPNESEEEDADRYLVAFAVRSVGDWLVAEVWVNHRQILGINDLGEGLPLEDASWPWATSE